MTTRQQEVLKTPQQKFQENKKFLRDFAKQALVEDDASLDRLQYVKDVRMQAYLTIGATFALTERDLVFHLFNGVLDQEKGLIA